MNEHRVCAQYILFAAGKLLISYLSHDFVPVFICTLQIALIVYEKSIVNYCFIFCTSRVKANVWFECCFESNQIVSKIQS